MKELQRARNQYEKQKVRFEQGKNDDQRLLEAITKEVADCEQESNRIKELLGQVSRHLGIIDESMKQAERNYDTTQSQKPVLLRLQRLFNSSKAEAYFASLNQANDMLNDLMRQKKELSEKQLVYEKELKDNDKKISGFRREQHEQTAQFVQWEKEQKSQLHELEGKVKELEQMEVLHTVKGVDFSQSYNELQKSNPWSDIRFRILQTELFISALEVKKQFLYENRKNVGKARMIWKKQSEYASKENGSQIISTAWQWLNCVIPVISTTFASFRSMFGNMPENSISNLFIDEAGQALPQACVGAIFRSKKIMAVGDPAQIKPVLTLDAAVLNLVGRHYHVDEKYVSDKASVQTIMDDAGKYGFYKTQDEWIGIPLWVHRRSNYPMFTISNQISYNGLMVQGKREDVAQGKACWYHVEGTANNKFVKEQADLLTNLIQERVENDSSLKNEIYVISPFKNVAYQTARELDKINFTKRDKKKKLVNVGTVHTFQGKEAKIVYLILGADNTSKAAAAWAVSEPNIMNVAATRAREEFYIIGDKELYASLGSKVINTTIQIIDAYMCLDHDGGKMTMENMTSTESYYFRKS